MERVSSNQYGIILSRCFTKSKAGMLVAQFLQNVLIPKTAIASQFNLFTRSWLSENGHSEQVVQTITL